MRIVAGEFRGRTISAPDGEATRPTSDRVREALFSSLYSQLGGFEGAVVLDAFAGSGALGLEALSRGAARAVFFERDERAAAVLKKNVRACGLDDSRAKVVRRDVMGVSPDMAGGPFDLVLLDPPYRDDPSAVLEMTSRLIEGGSVSADALVVYEHATASREAVGEAAARLGYDVLTCKKYGKTMVTMVRYGHPGDADSPAGA